MNKSGLIIGVSTLQGHISLANKIHINVMGNHTDDYAEALCDSAKHMYAAAFGLLVRTCNKAPASPTRKETLAIIRSIAAIHGYTSYTGC